jgi:LPS O-antigen subunit length determinant protein (WzzB/FepE family)
MKKTQNDELNLLHLFETLWRKKFTLFFITVISLFLGIFYTVNQKITFKVSTPIYYAKQSLFIKYRVINEVLKENESVLIENELDSYLVDEQSIFDKFIIEFQDYEEMKSVLKNNKFVKDSIKNLSKADEKIRLISLAKSFRILTPSNKNDETTLSFSWHNDVEGKRLFTEAILLTLENIKKTLKNDVNLLAESMNEKNKRLIQGIKNQINLIEYSIELETKKRNQFLNEHYKLAKEMNIESNLHFPHSDVQANQVRVMPSTLKDLEIALNIDDHYFVTYDNNFSNLPYYLRGYKTIKKEIEILKSRSKEQQLLMSSGYVNLKKKLLALQKNSSASQLKKIADSIENDVSDKWVNFNFERADIGIQNKSIIFIFLSLIVGFLIGSIYIVISSSLNYK